MQTIVFFDIDSTLVENHFSPTAIGEVLAEVEAASGKTLYELGREMGLENARRQQEDPDHPLTMDWDDILDTVAARYGVRLSRRGIDAWHDHAHPEAVEVLDNAPQVLADLKDMGCTLVIATKGLLKYQEPVLRAAGLWHFFDDVLTPDLTGYLKTSPEYFARYTAERDGRRFIQVGDHYYDDVICAVRNGFESLLRAPIADLQAYSPLERVLRLGDYIHQVPTYPEDGTDTRPSAVMVSLEEVPTWIASTA
jgi:FMN phosphatase YigB (HAD superfamily)